MLIGLAAPLLMMLAWGWWSRGGYPADSPSLGPSSRMEPKSHARDPRLPEAEARATPAARSPSLLDSLDDWSDRLRARRDPSESDPYRQARLLLSSRKYDQAVRAFDRLLVLEPDNREAMHGKAMALSGAGRFEDALPLFERSIERWPNETGIRFDWAVALMRAGRLDQSYAEFEALVRNNPNNDRMAYNLAVLDQARGRYAEAATAWRKWIATWPRSDRLTEAWFHLGECALALSDFNEAETCFQKVIQAEPRDAAAWCNLGIARAGQIRRADALSALEEALRINPVLVEALNQTAFIHAAVFRDTETLDSARRVVEHCDRSLAINAAQPNIRALRDATKDLLREIRAHYKEDDHDE